jgi:hypothetical protein
MKGMLLILVRMRCSDEKLGQCKRLKEPGLSLYSTSVADGLEKVEKYLAADHASEVTIMGDLASNLDLVLLFAVDKAELRASFAQDTIEPSTASRWCEPSAKH